MVQFDRSLLESSTDAALSIRTLVYSAVNTSEHNRVTLDTHNGSGGLYRLLSIQSMQLIYNLIHTADTLL